MAHLLPQTVPGRLPHNRFVHSVPRISHHALPPNQGP